MHIMSVYNIACEHFIRYQPVVCMLAHSEDFCTHVAGIVHALLHTRVLVKFKSSCTVYLQFQLLLLHAVETNYSSGCKIYIRLLLVIDCMTKL